MKIAITFKTNRGLALEPLTYAVVRQETGWYITGFGRPFSWIEVLEFITPEFHSTIKVVHAP